MISRFAASWIVPAFFLDLIHVGNPHGLKFRRVCISLLNHVLAPFGAPIITEPTHHIQKCFQFMEPEVSR